jgi:hypothetical protein
MCPSTPSAASRPARTRSCRCAAAAATSRPGCCRVVGLDQAAALLPGFDQAGPAGLTIIDLGLHLPV